MCCISVYITIKLAWHAEQYTSAICCIVRLITQKNLKMLEFSFPPQMKYNFFSKDFLIITTLQITVETKTPVRSIYHTHHNIDM